VTRAEFEYERGYQRGYSKAVVDVLRTVKQRQDEGDQPSAETPRLRLVDTDEKAA
jgi:hypothetical protein